MVSKIRKLESVLTSAKFSELNKHREALLDANDLLKITKSHRNKQLEVIESFNEAHDSVKLSNNMVSNKEDIELENFSDLNSEIEDIIITVNPLV